MCQDIGDEDIAGDPKLRDDQPKEEEAKGIDEDDEDDEDDDEEEEKPLENYNPKVLANTKEKYMQVGIGNILFSDSMKFNKASLAKKIDAQRAPYDKWVKDGKGR